MAVAALVDTVAQRLTRAKLSEVEDRARRYILRHFADAGRAPGGPPPSSENSSLPRGKMRRRS